MFDESKPWYTSRAIWGSIIAIVSSAFLLTGHTVAPEIQSVAADLLAQAGSVVGGALALYGRLKAEKKIGA